MTDRREFLKRGSLWVAAATGAIACADEIADWLSPRRLLVNGWDAPKEIRWGKQIHSLSGSTYTHWNVVEWVDIPPPVTGRRLRRVTRTCPPGEDAISFSTKAEEDFAAIVRNCDV